MFAAGVDAITLGNHAYHRREIFRYLDEDERDRAARPTTCASSPAAAPASSSATARASASLNLSGNVFLRAARPAFAEIESILDDFERRGCDHVLVDMHAEATSEKVAMGWHLDGRVTAVVGTHTHVPTADARVLPGGTAYISDVGMTGPRGGVIGVKKEQAIESLRHADARALRDLRGRPVAQRRRHPLLAASGGPTRSSRCCFRRRRRRDLRRGDASRPRNAISASGATQTR